MVSAVMPTYLRQPVAFVRGQGVWLYDALGHAYLDALSGIAVCGLGHAHPKITAALAEQAATLIHTSNLYQIPLQDELAARLCQISGMQQVFFCNSGAEANEAALKLARLHGHRRGITAPEVLVMEQSFHGRTMATLAATGNPKVQRGFAPLMPGFVRVPFGDTQAINQALEQHPQIVAILVEPIQGESGVRMPDQGVNDWLHQLRTLCDTHNLLLMLDEIQTGNGRTGRYFAYQHSAMLPDVVTTAKGLGNGFPIGAVLVQGKAVDLFSPGMHGSTFGGTPLACRVALATIEQICNGAMANAEEQGAYIQTSLRQRLRTFDVEITGLGLMIGVILPKDAPTLVDAARKAGLLFALSSGNRIRLLPPLIITKEEADLLIDRLTAVVSAFLNTPEAQ